MEAVLNVENLAYCKIDIEDTPMPPSFNLIDEIIMQEGMGIAAPTLSLHFFDQTGSLQRDLNLSQGTKCTITLARYGSKDQLVKRTFSLWSTTRNVSDAGPLLTAIFTLDAPKWIAGVYCENFRASSSQAIQNMAASSGLNYSGPSGGTSDTMNWLNVNTTRSSFSEDVAMRGYASNASCMARALTLDSEVRYKNLFEELSKDDKAQFLLNDDSEIHDNPVLLRETQETSISGVMAHWFNFGQIQHEHSLNLEGQQITDRILAPVMGSGFPISDRVKQLISDSEGSRVAYTGLDPGTEPKPQSNIHSNYERAFYQNLRGLGLFTERMRVLGHAYTRLSTFDCVKYIQRDPEGNQFVHNQAVNGKYLVGGKTIRIKNGHNYSEVFDLIRPYLTNPGESSPVSQSDSNRQASANRGDFDLTEETPSPNQVPQSESPSPKKPRTDIKPQADRAENLADSLNQYDEANPSIPSAPQAQGGSMSPSDPQIEAQNKVMDAVADIHKDDNQISNSVEASKAGFDPGKHHTVKKMSAGAVKSSANETISTVDQNKQEGRGDSVEDFTDPQKKRTSVEMDKPVLDRFAGEGKQDGAPITQEEFSSTVTSTTAQDKKVGDPVGDLQKGGVFAEDFKSKGLDVPRSDNGASPQSISMAADTSNSSDLGDEVDPITQEKNLGLNFTFPASKFELGSDDSVIGPKQVAKFLKQFAEERKSPEKFLRDKGAQAYREAFGEASMKDAEETIERLANKVKELEGRYNEGEILAGVPGSLSNATKPKNSSSSQQLLDEIRNKVPDSSVKLPEDSGVELDFSGASDKKEERKYAQKFDFQYGDGDTSPLIEKVKDKVEISPDATTIKTVREQVSWAVLTQMGSDAAKKKNSDEKWEFPHESPFSVFTTDEGDSGPFDFNVGGPLWT